MSGPSKVIVLDPDPRAGRQVQLGFEREGIPASTPTLPADPARVELDGPPGLVMVGGSNGVALDLLRRARQLLDAAGSNVSIVFTGGGSFTRTQLEDAGADEVLARPVYLRDLVTIGRVLRDRPAVDRGHIVGSLAETTGVYTLVRAFSALGRSAVLTLIRGLRRGEVRFYRGEVTSAQVGLIHGQAAFHQLLLWTDARFDFAHEDIVRRQQIPLSPDELFADAERFLEGVRESAGALSPATVLEPDIQRVQDLGKQIPTEVHGVLRMFDGHRVLADILEDSPYRVFETLRVAQKAVEAGLLRPIDSQRPKATWKAVLAIEEWLVGSETREAVVERTQAIESGPLPAPRGKAGNKGKRRKKQAAPAPPADGAARPSIDWGALVPRVIGAEVGPLSPIVPAQATAGEVEVATRDKPREGLEALMDTDKRDKIFPTEIGLEPKVVINADTTDEWERVVAEAKAKASTEITAPVPLVEAETKSGSTRAKKKQQTDTAKNKRRSKPKIDTAEAVKAAEAVEAEQRAAKAEAEAKAAVEAAERARIEAERVRIEAEAKAKAKAEAEERQRLEAEAKAKAEADRIAAEAKAKAEADERARLDAEAKAKAEAERIAAEARAKAEADERARLDAEAKAKAEADARRADAEERRKSAEQELAAAQAKVLENVERMRLLRLEREEAETKVKEASTRSAAAEEARAYAARVKAAAEAKRLEAERNASPASAPVEETPPERPSLDATELVKALVADVVPTSTAGTPPVYDIPTSISAAITAPVPKLEETDAVTTPFIRPDAIDDSVRTHLVEPITVAETPATSVAVADVLTVKGAADTAHLTATPHTLIREATPSTTEDEPSDGVIQATIEMSESERRARALRNALRPPMPAHDGPPQKETTGEIRQRAQPDASKTPDTSEPSILVADLAAVHAAATAIATAPIAAAHAQSSKPPSDAATSSRELEVSDVRRDAVAFSDDEEAFFNKAESHTHTVPKLESFDDLDEGYEPPGFWDRVFGRTRKKK